MLCAVKRVLLLIAFFFILSACGGGGGGSSTSDTGTTQSGDTPTASLSLLTGSVSSFPEAGSTGGSADIVRRLPTPVAQLQRSAAYFASNTAGTQTRITANDMVPANALVSLCVLTDPTCASPVATVKTNANGAWTVNAAQVRPYLLENNLISSAATDAEVRTALTGLGKLLVNATVVKQTRDSDGNVVLGTDGRPVLKAVAIKSIADPEDVDPNTGEPNPTRVDPIIASVTDSILTTIEAALEELDNTVSGFVGVLPDQAVAEIRASIQQQARVLVDTVTSDVAEIFAASDGIDIPEGSNFDQVAANIESQIEIDVDASGDDASRQAVLESILQASQTQSDDIDSGVLQEFKTKALVAEEKIPPEERTLTDVLDTTVSGLTQKLKNNASDAQADTLDRAAQDVSGTIDSGELATVTASFSAGKNRVLREGLQNFFMSMGFAVVVDQNDAGDAAVVAINQPMPFNLTSADLPGGKGFERQFRLFKIGSGTLDNDSAYTSQADCSDFTVTINGTTGERETPLFCAPPLNSLSADITETQNEIDAAFNATIDPNLTPGAPGGPTEADFRLVDRVRTYNEITNRLAEAPVVSAAVINRLIESRSATVRVKRLAAVMAENFQWFQESVNLAPNALPIFTDRNSALPGSERTVNSAELIRLLGLTLADSAAAAATDLTTRASFFSQFAANAIQESISRGQFEQGVDFNLEDTLLNIYNTQGGYQALVLGFNGAPPTRAYEIARAKIAKGLTTAVPNTLFGQTLTSESQINVRSALFLLNYLLQLNFLIDPDDGYFTSFDMQLAAGGDEQVAVPNFKNLKYLRAGDGVTVGRIVSSLLNITEIDNGTFFDTIVSTLQTRVTGLPTIPEFKEQDVTEFADDLGGAQADTASITFTVERFDGIDPQRNGVDNLEFSVFPVVFTETGALRKSSALTAGVDYSISSQLAPSDDSSDPVRRTYTISGLSTNNGGTPAVYGREYVVRLNIDAYENDLPEVFAYLDGWVPDTVLFDARFPLFIGPDVQFVPIPGVFMVDNQRRFDFNGGPGEFEGVDVSAMLEPGAPLIVTPSEETSGFGAADFRLASDSDGLSLQSVGTGVGFAPVYGDYVSGSLVTSLFADHDSDTGTPALPTFQGLVGLVGNRVRDLIQQAIDTPALLQSTISFETNPDNFIYDQVFLMQDRDGRYWLIEARFLDSFLEPGTNQNRYGMDIGIAQITSVGTVDVPEPEFDDFTPSGAAGSDGGPDGPGAFDNGGFRFEHMLYGDYLVLENPTGYTGPTLLEPREVSFDPNRGEYTTLDNATDGVFMRYSVSHFEDNITSVDDFDTVFGNPPDYSSIPVTLNAGRAGITFVKLSFNRQERRYTATPAISVNATTGVVGSSAATTLKHNDIVAIFEDATSDEAAPAYLARIIRDLPSDDPYANFELRMEVIRFNASDIDSSGGFAPQDVACFSATPDADCAVDLDGDGTNDPLPRLVYANSTDTTRGYVFDADQDGVPGFFDPNDTDPNIPGSAPSTKGPAGSGGPGGGAFEGLKPSLVYQADSSGNPTVSFLLETFGVWPGELDTVSVSITQEGDGGYRLDSSNVFSCTPPSFDDSTGVYTDFSCSAGTVTGLTIAQAFNNGFDIGFTVDLGASTMTNLLGSRVDVDYVMTFRQPTDFATGQPFMCGSEACPARPAIRSGQSFLIPSTNPTVLSDMDVKVGTASPTSLAGLASLEVSQNLTFSANPVVGAVDYELQVACPEQNDDFYFPPEFVSFFAPARQNGVSVPPTFENLSLPWLGGRTCDITFRAFVENEAGEFIGLSRLAFNDVIFSGGNTGGGGFFDPALVLEADTRVCLDTTANFLFTEAAASCPTGSLEVLSVPTDATFDTTARSVNVLMGPAVQSARLDQSFEVVYRSFLAETNADLSNATVDLDMDLTSANFNATCGQVSSDDFNTSCHNGQSIVPVLERVNDSLVLTSAATTAGLSLVGDFVESDGSVDLSTDGLKYVYVFDGSREILGVEVDIFPGFDFNTGASTGSNDVWVRVDSKGASQVYSLSDPYDVANAGFTLYSDSYIYMQIVNSNQPYGFWVRRMREDRTKMDWWPEPVSVSLSGDIDLNEDAIADVRVTDNSGEYALTFLGTTSGDDSRSRNVSEVLMFVPGQTPQYLNVDFNGNYLTTLSASDGTVEFEVAVERTDGGSDYFFFRVDMSTPSNPRVEINPFSKGDCCGGPNQGPNTGSIDSDNDGFPDDEDDFPFNPTEWADTDEDGLGDNADVCAATADTFDESGLPVDTDADGIPDACELEDSNANNIDLQLDGLYYTAATVTSVTDHVGDSSGCAMIELAANDTVYFFEEYEQVGDTVRIIDREISSTRRTEDLLFGLLSEDAGTYTLTENTVEEDEGYGLRFAETRSVTFDDTGTEHVFSGTYTIAVSQVADENGPLTTPVSLCTAEISLTSTEGADLDIANVLDPNAGRGLGWLEVYPDYNNMRVEYEYGLVSDSGSGLEEVFNYLDMDATPPVFVAEGDTDMEQVYALDTTSGDWALLNEESTITLLDGANDGLARITLEDNSSNVYLDGIAGVSGWDVANADIAQLVLPFWSTRVTGTPANFSTGAQLMVYTNTIQSDAYIVSCDEDYLGTGMTCVNQVYYSNSVLPGATADSSTTQNFGVPQVADSLDDVVTTGTENPVIVNLRGNENEVLQAKFFADQDVSAVADGAGGDVEFELSRAGAGAISLGRDARFTVSSVGTNGALVMEFSIPRRIAELFGVDVMERNVIFTVIPEGAGMSGDATLRIGYKVAAGTEVNRIPNYNGIAIADIVASFDEEGEDTFSMGDDDMGGMDDPNDPSAGDLNDPSVSDPNDPNAGDPNDPSISVDSDFDGVRDDEDAFPNDPRESSDFDEDGVGDYADLCPHVASSANGVNHPDTDPQNGVGDDCELIDLFIDGTYLITATVSSQPVESVTGACDGVTAGETEHFFATYTQIGSGIMQETLDDFGENEVRFGTIDSGNAFRILDSESVMTSMGALSSTETIEGTLSVSSLTATMTHVYADESGASPVEVCRIEYDLAGVPGSFADLTDVIDPNTQGGFGEINSSIDFQANQVSYWHSLYLEGQTLGNASETSFFYSQSPTPGFYETSAQFIDDHVMLDVASGNWIEVPDRFVLQAGISTSNLVLVDPSNPSNTLSDEALTANSWDVSGVVMGDLLDALWANRVEIAPGTANEKSPLPTFSSGAQVIELTRSSVRDAYRFECDYDTISTALDCMNYVQIGEDVSGNALIATGLNDIVNQPSETDKRVVIMQAASYSVDVILSATEALADGVNGTAQFVVRGSGIGATDLALASGQFSVVNVGQLMVELPLPEAVIDFTGEFDQISGLFFTVVDDATQGPILRTGWLQSSSGESYSSLHFNGVALEDIKREFDLNATDDLNEIFGEGEDPIQGEGSGGPDPFAP